MRIFVAGAIGVIGRRLVPKFVARLRTGRLDVYMTTGLQGASNATARRELGFVPRWPSWRQGFQEALG